MKAIMEQAEPTSAPDLVFVDAALLAYRLGHVQYAEQRTALLAAARVATDAISFMRVMEDSGVGRRSQLHDFVGKVLAAPAYYRAQYPLILGIRKDGEEAESFLKSKGVLPLVEGLLTIRQREAFYEAYWWFVHNHQPSFYDPRRGHCIGVWATDPQDNAATIARFDAYLQRLLNHKTQRVRERFYGFPADIVMAVLKRAFL